MDVAYGGAIYARGPGRAFGLPVAPEQLAELIAAGRAVKAELDGTDAPATRPTTGSPASTGPSCMRLGDGDRCTSAT